MKLVSYLTNDVESWIHTMEPFGLNLRTVDRGEAVKGDTFSRVCDD